MLLNSCLVSVVHVAAVTVSCILSPPLPLLNLSLKSWGGSCRPFVSPAGSDSLGSPGNTGHCSPTLLVGRRCRTAGTVDARFAQGGHLLVYAEQLVKSDECEGQTM